MPSSFSLEFEGNYECVRSFLVDLIQIISIPLGNTPIICVVHKTVEMDGSLTLNTNNAIVSGCCMPF